MIVFEEQFHKYSCIDDPSFLWESVTGVTSKYKQPFDGEATANKVSRNKKSKWFGIDPVTILKVWKNESNRACTLGNWYHGMREENLINCSTIGSLPVFPSVTDLEGRKVAQDQKLTDGIYPELMIYLKSDNLIGQSDLVEVIDGFVNIIDYKTNKKIETESFKSWEGIQKMMTGPVSNLQDCNFYHYALQLSFYMYMILRQNPLLKPGTLTIHHILFEEEGADEYGYPITKYSPSGEPIIKELVLYKMPYLKSEVMKILKHRKNAKI